MDKERLDGDYAALVTLMSVKSLSNLVVVDIKMQLDLNKRPSKTFLKQSRAASPIFLVNSGGHAHPELQLLN
jgi:hypothetical protein